MEDIGNFITELNGRILCIDGESIVDLPFLYQQILEGKDISKLFVPKKVFKTDEVSYYNKKFPQQKLSYKTSINPTNTDWLIPTKYLEMDVFEYIKDKLREEIHNYESELTKKEIEIRYFRCKMEYRIIKKRGLEDMLRALIYIVDKFEEHNVVWGTGRGSSCALYILYLIGLHQVDSVKYDIDVGEFLR